MATRWVSHFNANRIMVIDDAVAANDVEKMLLRSAAPEGCNTSILSFEKASANILAGNYDGQRVLILLKTPELALKLMNAGIALPSSISAICPTKTIAARSNARSASTMLRSRPSTRCWKRRGGDGADDAGRAERLYHHVFKSR